jgi:hypothetical protein
MGLFGGILNGLGGILGAVVGARDNAHAVKKAGNAEIDALNRAMGLENAQYEQTRQDYAPYTAAGASAIGSAGDLTGANGTDKWQAALAALKDSPMFQSLFRTGQEATLQNASATGGLRGGNTERGLADFGADTFAKTIQEQLSNLMGIANLGGSVVTNQGALGAANAANVGNQTVGTGQVRAGSILGQQQVYNNLSQQIQKIIGQFMPTGGFSF